MKFAYVITLLLLCALFFTACMPMIPDIGQTGTEQKTQALTQEQPSAQESTQQATEQNTEQSTEQNTNQQSEQTAQPEQVTTEEQTTFGPLHFPEDTTE